MRIFALLLASAACLAAPVAFADNFSGAYAGVVGGANVNADKKVETIGTAGFLGLPTNVTPRQLEPKADGGLFGGVAGVNFGSGGLVYGLEGDLTTGGMDGTVSSTGAAVPGLAPAGITTTAKRDLGTRGSVRGRIGTELGESTLLYGTAGLAFGRAEAAGIVTVPGAPTLAWNGRKEKTLSGWVIGAGGEQALTDRLHARLEYLYTDLGDVDFSATGNAAVRSVAALNGVDYQGKAKFKSGQIRAGLTFKF